MLTKPKLLLCLAFAAVLAGCDGGNPGVDASSMDAGIITGQPLESQRALIARANSKFQLTDITSLVQGGLLGIEASQEGTIPGLPVDDLMVLQNANGLVWFVERSREFKQGEEIPVKTLMNSLNEKYGPFTITHSENEKEFSLGWIFDQQGKLVILNFESPDTGFDGPKELVKQWASERKAWMSNNQGKFVFINSTTDLRNLKFGAVIEATMSNEEGIMNERLSQKALAGFIVDKYNLMANSDGIPVERNGSFVDKNGNPVNVSMDAIENDATNFVLDFLGNRLVSHFDVTITDRSLSSKTDFVIREGVERATFQKEARKKARAGIKQLEQKAGEGIEQGLGQLLNNLK
jgi:hypothetical protein